MSYDLFFRSRDGGPPLAELRHWFAGRAHYTVGEDEAGYDNPATGVYFRFRIGMGDDGPDVDFNINYFRPSSFGLEAAPELGAFTSAFAFAMSDPQAEGMGDGPFTTEGFLRGYNHGNRFAYRAVSSMGEAAQTLTLPRRVVAESWAWNHAREAYMDNLASIEMICGFAPTVLYLVPQDAPQTVLTAAVWGQGMGCSLPEVDVVVALSDHGDAPRVIPVDLLRAHLDRYPRREAHHRFTLDRRSYDCGLPHWLIDHDEPPPELLEALATLGAPRAMSRASPDQVLDREWFGA